MSPLPPEDPITLPEWALQYLIAPAAVGMFSLLYWLGGHIVSNWESEREQLRSEVEAIKAEIREMRDEMGSDHGDVEDYVQRLDDKLDQIHQEVGS